MVRRCAGRRFRCRSCGRARTHRGADAPAEICTAPTPVWTAPASGIFSWNGRTEFSAVTAPLAPSLPGSGPAAQIGGALPRQRAGARIRVLPQRFALPERHRLKQRPAYRGLGQCANRAKRTRLRETGALVEPGPQRQVPAGRRHFSAFCAGYGVEEDKIRSSPVFKLAEILWLFRVFEFTRNCRTAWTRDRPSGRHRNTKTSSRKNCCRFRVAAALPAAKCVEPPPPDLVLPQRFTLYACGRDEAA